MPSTLSAIEFIAAPAKHLPAAVIVLFGDEPFLKRLSLDAIRESLLGEDDADLSLSRVEGPTSEWRVVFDELSTVAMFGNGPRLVVVEDADDFVSEHRQKLEDYVAAPRNSGLLILVVKTWPSNTRLYKAVERAGLQIDCKPPVTATLVKWLATWAEKRHDAKLDRDAAQTLVEIVGPELGLLDQKLAMLAATVGPGKTIDAQLVRETVGGWRAKTVWEMIDAATAGEAPRALDELDRLLTSGEQPIAILAQIASTLRRFAAATRLIEHAERANRRVQLRDALTDAGFKPFVLGKAEAQLRQLGRRRAGQLYQQLLDADLALKGASSAPYRARLVLEKLIARMSAAVAKENAAAAVAAPTTRA
jgi:DNA polymerase-3 subunit delta